MEKQRIPIFGPYHNGNFGDDLMGHLIAKHLLKKNFHPVLWKGPIAPIENIKWETCSDINTLIGNAPFIIYGGGLPFCNAEIPFWDDLNAMIDVCEKKNISVIAISIGSQGNHTNLHPIAIKFANSKILKAASLRLEIDVPWLNQLGKDVEYIPDIVLTALPYRKRQNVKNVLLSIAINYCEYPFLYGLVNKLFSHGINVKTISQFMDKTINSKSFFHFPKGKIENTGPDTMLKAILESDIVVTTGLHPGITALSNGADMISYRGQGKALSFLNQIGRSNNIIRANSKIAKIFSTRKLSDLILNFQFGDDNLLLEMKYAAERHYSFLDAKIEQFIN